jgi:hypothetical protein
VAERRLAGGKCDGFFVLSTIILGVWAPLGPLVGIRYGHELSKRLQREHWLRDNEKQEYREVLRVLTSSFATIVRCGSTGVVIGGEEMRTRNQEILKVQLH